MFVLLQEDLKMGCLPVFGKDITVRIEDSRLFHLLICVSTSCNICYRMPRWWRISHYGCPTSVRHTTLSACLLNVPARDTTWQHWHTRKCRECYSRPTSRNDTGRFSSKCTLYVLRSLLLLYASHHEAGAIYTADSDSACTLHSVGDREGRLNPHSCRPTACNVNYQKCLKILKPQIRSLAKKDFPLKWSLQLHNFAPKFISGEDSCISIEIGKPKHAGPENVGLENVGPWQRRTIYERVAP